MIVKKYLLEATETIHYEPSVQEMYWYYSGTHAGLNPDNPYKRYVPRTTIKYKKVRS